MSVKPSQPPPIQAADNRRLIYKATDHTAWLEAVRAGVYAGSADDLRDGYMHFSTADQLAGTLAKYYAGRDDLVLVAVDPVRLDPALKWEPARGGALFPHLYGVLAIADVAWTLPLPRDGDGLHRLPEGVT